MTLKSSHHNGEPNVAMSLSCIEVAPLRYQLHSSSALQRPLHQKMRSRALGDSIPLAVSRKPGVPVEHRVQGQHLTEGLVGHCEVEETVAVFP